jgi:hypothetical protein
MVLVAQLVSVLKMSIVIKNATFRRLTKLVAQPKDEGRWFISSCWGRRF